jgi:putative endonuclease
MNKSNFYIYITTNPGKTVLYTGVTNDLKRRLAEHFINRGKIHSFAGKYYCYNLIYYEYYTDIHQAIRREKEIKNLSRKKKMDMIKKSNPLLKFRVLE